MPPGLYCFLYHIRRIFQRQSSDLIAELGKGLFPLPGLLFRIGIEPLAIGHTPATGFYNIVDEPGQLRAVAQRACVILKEKRPSVKTAFEELTS